MVQNILAVVVPSIVAAIGTIASAWIMRPRTQTTTSTPIPTQTTTPTTITREISRSLIIGIISLMAWLLPIVGLPLSLVGLGTGVNERSRMPTVKLSTTGIMLNIVGLMAATANSAIGAYLGYHGMLF